MVTRQLIVDRHFDLDAILDGTQDFRWRPWRDHWYSGVLVGNLIHIRQSNCGVEYRADSDLNALLVSYFRLEDDIDGIGADIAGRDDTVARLVKKYQYLRIFRQPDPWECTVSYICSARNNLAGISRTVEKIAEALGQQVYLDSDVRHTFPSPEIVINAGIGSLTELRLGLDRHSKIIAAAQRIRYGKLNLCYLAQPNVSYSEAKRELMTCDGIGHKIASCIALFGLDKVEAFPEDTWVKKAVAGYFPNQQQPSGDKLAMWARTHFGKYAGYANQLLFQEQRRLENQRRRRDAEGD